MTESFFVVCLTVLGVVHGFAMDVVREASLVRIHIIVDAKWAITVHVIGYEQ